MPAIRKLLAVLATLLSILLIFLNLGLIARTLSDDHPPTFFDRVAPWLMVVLLGGLSLLLMKFADKTLR